MKKGILLIVLLFVNTTFFSQNSYVLSFDGTDDYLKLDDNATMDSKLNGASDYTIEMWVLPMSSTIHNKVLIARWFQFRVTMYQDANKRFYFTHKDASGTNTFINSTNNALTIGQWNHIAVICNSSANRIYLYVNGSDVTDGTPTALTLRGDSSLDNLYIGYGSAGTYPAVFIDEVRISNVAYSIGSLNTNKNDPPYTPNGSTALLLHMNEGTGSTTTDAASGDDVRMGSADIGDAQEPSWTSATAAGLPLPVELTFFEATKVDGNIILNWETATEVNNYGFEIQRSSFQNDGATSFKMEWKKIGFVDGHGNSNSSKSYSFVDIFASGNISYRLKQIDIDGGFEYSNVVKVKTNLNYKLIQNHPNPFNPETTISFSIPETSKVLLTIYNTLGQEVAELINKDLYPGIYSVNFNATTLNSGVYYYRLQTPNFSKTKKMLLIK